MATTLGPADEIQEGEAKAYEVDGRKIAIALIEGEYYAFDDTCTHAECSLAEEGFMDGKDVICGCHGAIFDATTGEVKSLPAPTDLNTYPVSVRDGNLYLER